MRSVESPAKRSSALDSLYSDHRSIAGAAAAGIAAAAGDGPPVGTEAIGRGRWWSKLCGYVVGMLYLMS